MLQYVVKVKTKREIVSCTASKHTALPVWDAGHLPALLGRLCIGVQPGPHELKRCHSLAVDEQN